MNASTGRDLAERIGKCKARIILPARVNHKLGILGANRLLPHRGRKYKRALQKSIPKLGASTRFEAAHLCGIRAPRNAAHTFRRFHCDRDIRGIGGSDKAIERKIEEWLSRAGRNRRGRENSYSISVH